MKSPVVILVNPQMAENVGMSARAMMNCGLYEMRIVSPRENHLSDKAVAASSGADKILREARLYNTTQEAVADLGLVYATTARRRNMIKIVETAEGAAREINLKSQVGIKCGILFGPERTGLHNDDVALADKIIEIPLNPEHCSLNLSQAVLLSGYEIYKHHVDVPDVQLVTNGGEIADKEKINRFFAFLDEKLSGCKAFQDDEKRPRMLINLHNIFQRGEITEPELNTLYGIINYLSQK
ncbi:MAG: RNA methyltransferase [Pseudomonadota bacterium]|nr:RNA methyltransferase [Pseudomonadota bacterium]